MKCDSLLVTGKLSDLEVNFLLVHHLMGLWNLSTHGNSSLPNDIFDPILKF